MEQSTAGRRRPRIIGLGEVLWDLLPSGKCLGGAPANFAFHAGQLGADAVAVSAIGRDALGEEIEARFSALGLRADGLRRVDAPTGTVTVAMGADGKPGYTIHTGVAWDELPFDAGLEALAQQADAVCFGSLAQRAPASRRSVRAFVGATRKGCLRIFDINLRQRYFDRETIEASLAAADILKLNDEELPTLAELLALPADEHGAIAALLERYALRLVALTRGADGSLLVSPFRVSRHPGIPPERLVDTVGAGDAFTAALALGLLALDDLDRIHERASRLARFVCSQAGATPTVPPELRR